MHYLTYQVIVRPLRQLVPPYLLAGTAFLDDLSPSFTANKQYGQAPCNPQQAPEHLDADHSSLRHRRIPPRRRPAGLPSATPPDRRRRLRPDAECAGGVDGGAVGGDAADDILGGQNGL